MERYEVIERLAVGGMGEVFLARQRGQGGFARTVVIKQLLPDAHEEGEQAHRLLDEARLAASVAHENVVTIHEVGLDDGRPFLAMEYVHGVPLSALTRRAEKQGAPLSPAVAARIVLDAARGLHAAHVAADAGGRPLAIVHRDVAPKNILVRVDGIAKITDFGVAAGADRLCRTATGAVPGTLSYMAPEQASDGHTSPRSDQFALGVVLWELLCGERLFRAELPSETLKRLFHLDIAAPSAVVEGGGGINPALDAVVLRMLSREPAQRFADLAEAARALDRAVPGLSGDAARARVARAVRDLAGAELDKRQARLEGNGASEGERTVILPQRGASTTPLTNDAARLPDDVTTRARDAATRPDTGSRRRRAGPAQRRVSRARVVLAVGGALLALTLGGVGGVAARGAWGALDREALTRAWAAKEVVEGPIVYAAMVGEYAEERGTAPADADVVVTKLEALMAARIALVNEHWRKDEPARASSAAALEKELVRFDRDAKTALASWPADLAKRALDETRMFGRAPSEWLPGHTGGSEREHMLADVRRNGPKEMRGALRRAARRAAVDPSAVNDALPALEELFLARFAFAERMQAEGAASVRVEIDDIEARAKNVVAERFPAHFFQTAYTLWRARGDIGEPGEPLPAFGPGPGDVDDVDAPPTDQLALAEAP